MTKKLPGDDNTMDQVYRLMHDSAGSGIGLFTPDGVIISLNSTAAGLMNGKPEDFAGKSIYDFFPKEEADINISHLRVAAESSAPSVNEAKINLPEGAKWFQSDYNRIVDEKGNLIGIQVIATDITERKTAEDKLRKAENRFRALIENAPDGVVLVSAERKFTFASPAALRMFGYTADELSNLLPDELTYPEDLPLVHAELFKVFSDPSYIPTIRYRFTGKDGTLKWIESTFTNMTGNKDIHAIVINFRDITEQKESEEALRISQNKFQAIFVNNSAAIAIIEPDTTISMVNDAYCKMSGYTEEEVVGMSWTKQIYPDDLERLKEYNRQRLSNADGIPSNYEFRFYRRNGQLRHALIYVSLIESTRKIIAAFNDITESKKAEEEMKESESRLNRAELASRSGNWELHLDTQMMIASEGATLIYGVNKTILQYSDIKEHALPEYRKMLDDAMKKLVENDVPYNVEFRIKATDTGEVKDIHSIARFDKKKNVLFGIIQDITAKKAVENKVNLLAHSLESVSECVSITDHDDIIIYINESFCNTYGYNEDELIGKHIGMLRPTELPQEQVKNILINTLKTGGWKGEIMNKRKDGSVFPILLSTSIVRDEQDMPIAMIGVAIDMTEMNKNRYELIIAKEKAEESDRLKSVFLANLSHEIRTPMNGIVGFANLLKDSSLTNEKRENFIQVINSSSTQLLAIISDIVEISKIETRQVKVIKNRADIHHIIDNVFNNLSILAQKKEHVKLTSKKEIPAKVYFINTDEVKLQQVLSNLVENSIKFTDAGQVNFGYYINKTNEIEFYVRDTGIGIGKENFSLIFDRFRKIENKDLQFKGGSGLGLAISKSYVELLGGRIWLESELGKGTTFYFTIPNETVEVLHTNPEKPVETTIDLSEVVLLIAEDDPANFYFINELLSKTSVKILHAWDGQEALEIFRSNNSIDLILMDIKMPKMNGNEATLEIRKVNKQIPIIAHTGYLLEEDKQRAKKMGFDDYLCKPVNEEELLTAIGRFVGKKKKT